MLGLKSETSARWLAQVDRDLDEVLIDHAHCEKKAAGTALNLIFAYVEDDQLCREMEQIVAEELEHFRLVRELLERRKIPFRRLRPSSYGRKLNDLVRKIEPGRAVDRLLVAGLIEARSCQRFAALRDHVPDPELAKFYGDLFAAEARHHATYVRLAKRYATETEVEQRLEWLAEREAEILSQGDPVARMHS
ncbi:MAG: tRNA-(ms[2]io[6]A)-hydroxylase [Planctomycetales bacterium]|nr:tRNA-(ms[2]io[6]A)-hydroxylase [Planctomycetales bacterium]NIM08000.1 tRNA-(ms[2]io[6]A)-hydroxylase [Planctomycetales bacterium]NIN07482.1 tRNA-(ms[2]io[6]A)-hydroxylase [Planctomycetales bacterium]NIN76585.1 tRNA-(ms[2]io[6]A)-hydroxylase [Planctomycetales bacterium]NIO33777.1 tRNA-(ms[2]io[6]A)-hydroxylase [Planctomycetales bacterium]